MISHAYIHGIVKTDELFPMVKVYITVVVVWMLLCGMTPDVSYVSMYVAKDNWD